MRLINRMLMLPLLAWLLSSPLARADVARAPGADLDVSLITYGPGDIYWERFGHDALELRDRSSGESLDFNYGMFDFDEKGFVLNFARGRMHYLMDADYSSPEQESYRQQGRSVTRQHLALTAEQAAALRDFLFWNLRPENAGYRYDYYVDNCTTRVRDALDRVLDGRLRQQLSSKPGGMTYRQQTARLMLAQPWLMLLLDLGLGPYADQPLNAWQESFLPMVLQTQLRSVVIGEDASIRPLVDTEQLQAPNRLTAPPEQAPDLRVPMALAGLVFAFVLLATRRYLPLGYALLGTAYLLLAGIAGLLMLILWTLTEHHSAWANANLLLFNPLAWLLLASLWRVRSGQAVTRLANTIIVLQLIAVVIAVLLHLRSGLIQQNQPWLLLAAPLWLAIAWTTRRGAIEIVSP